MSESGVEKRSPLPKDQKEEAKPTDSLLLAYLMATDEAQSEILAGQLISEHARPIIRSVISYRLRPGVHHSGLTHSYEDAEDLSSEVVLEVLTRLRQLKARPNDLPITNFRGYVAAITYRAYSEDLRKRKPQRATLKNKLRYILTHSPRLALWKSDGKQWLCGLAAWREQDCNFPPDSVRIRQLLDDPQAVSEGTGQDATRMNPVDLLGTIFNWAGSPIRFDDLISITGNLWGIKDHANEIDSYLAEDDILPDGLGHSRVDIESEIEQRLYLERIWLEIGDLPPRQRCALLLNLRDVAGEGVIALIPVIGVATFREIAEALEMPVQQLADLWNELPLDDAAIAALLGVKRQQVINLRKSARERLARRMKAAGQGASR